MNGLDFVLTVGVAPGEIQVRLAFDVAAAGQRSEPGAVEVFLPTWTPGSYLVREYSRHLSRVEAADAVSGLPLTCRKTSKNRFSVAVGQQTARIQLSYRVYAHELTVRTADVTAEHAFWNHACVLLWPVGAPSLPARITVELPESWQLASALPTEGPAIPSRIGKAVRLVADDMEHAYDSPCLAGAFERHSFDVRGVRHHVVLDGLGTVAPPATLLSDLQRVVDSVAAVFGGELPYREYLFLCLFTADAHGGLEHRDSTTLLISRTALHSERGYREFLALAAHELFHAWNVKRLRPVEFWRYDYERENYSEHLWLLEGWTAYFDDLLVMRAGLMSRSEYLDVIAKAVQAVWNAPGRLRLSLRESSFDAWIRLYRPDENTRNSSQNYYVNGSIAALCTDLAIREASGGQLCLDHVLRELWRATDGATRGFTIADVEASLKLIGGEAIAESTLRLVSGQLDPDLATLLRKFGLRLHAKDAERPFLGMQFESGSTNVASVTADSPAHAAGVQPADEILAIANLRVDARNWQDVFTAVAKVDAPLPVLLARRGVVQSLTAVPRRGPGTVSIEVAADATAEQLQLLDGWVPDGKRAKWNAAPAVTTPR